MENAGNLHAFVLDPVENAMALMADAANSGAIVWPRFADQRKCFELGEDQIDGTLVGIGGIVPEPFGAIFVDLDQVSNRVVTQPDFRHAGLGGWL